MKVLFLDVDHVLNSEKWLLQREEALKRIEGDIAEGGDGLRDLTLLSIAHDEQQIDPAAIEVLNEIMSRTKAVIVVSSTWRLDHSMPDIVNVLLRRGFKWCDRIIGCTLELDGPRGLEIQAWLEQVDVDTFAILDDNSDMGELMPQLVQTTQEKGLQPEHIEPVLQLLGEA
jgi:HAD domain in Swiss Army Knife RNA repair proteins